MAFTIYYRSTRALSRQRSSAIRRAAHAVNQGRTWLSCEPISFFQEQQDRRLFGGSKPNFQPNPDHVAAAATAGLPDGTVRDLIEGLCQLSRKHAVDWEFSHDYDPGPIGFIRDGVADERLLGQIEGFAEIGDLVSDAMAGFGEGRSDSSSSRSGTPDADHDDDDTDEEPRIIRLWPGGD